MPNCFTLTRKGQTSPESLQKVDDDLRIAFGLEPSDTEWAFEWYSWIGLGLALGRSFDDLRIAFAGTDLVPVIDYLQTNYESDSWSQR